MKNGSIKYFITCSLIIICNCFFTFFIYGGGRFDTKLTIKIINETDYKLYFEFDDDSRRNVYKTYGTEFKTKDGLPPFTVASHSSYNMCGEVNSSRWLANDEWYAIGKVYRFRVKTENGTLICSGDMVFAYLHQIHNYIYIDARGNSKSIIFITQILVPHISYFEIPPLNLSIEAEEDQFVSGDGIEELAAELTFSLEPEKLHFSGFKGAVYKDGVYHISDTSRLFFPFQEGNCDIACTLVSDDKENVYMLFGDYKYDFLEDLYSFNWLTDLADPSRLLLNCKEVTFADNFPIKTNEKDNSADYLTFYVRDPGEIWYAVFNIQGRNSTHRLSRASFNVENRMESSLMSKGNTVKGTKLQSIPIKQSNSYFLSFINNKQLYYVVLSDYDSSDCRFSTVTDVYKLGDKFNDIIDYKFYYSEELDTLFLAAMNSDKKLSFYKWDNSFLENAILGEYSKYNNPQLFKKVDDSEKNYKDNLNFLKMGAKFYYFYNGNGKLSHNSFDYVKNLTSGNLSVSSKAKTVDNIKNYSMIKIDDNAVLVICDYETDASKNNIGFSIGRIALESPLKISDYISEDKEYMIEPEEKKWAIIIGSYLANDHYGVPGLAHWLSLHPSKSKNWKFKFYPADSNSTDPYRNFVVSIYNDEYKDGEKIYLNHDIQNMEEWITLGTKPEKWKVIPAVGPPPCNLFSIEPYDYEGYLMIDPKNSHKLTIPNDTSDVDKEDCFWRIVPASKSE